MNAEAATAALRIRTQNEPIQPTQRWKDTASLNTWLQLNVAVHDHVTKDGGEIARILRDVHLSPEGRNKKLDVFGEGIVPTYAFVAAPLKDADAAITRARKLVYGPILERPKGGDTTEIVSREKEIRDAVRSFDKNQRNAHFLKALEHDDVETARAMLDAPGGSMVSAETAQRGQDQYAARTNKDAWERLQAIEYLREHLQSLAEQVATWLLSLGATPESVQKATKAKD